jgi:hypothetical protein
MVKLPPPFNAGQLVPFAQLRDKFSASACALKRRNAPAAAAAEGDDIGGEAAQSSFSGCYFAG